MFDGRLRQMIDPPLDRMGHRLAAAGLTADQVTIAGFLVGMLAGLAIANQLYLLGLLLLGAGRIADGLDGAVARATTKTDRGGFLDIVLDFFFYGAIPAAFAIANPAANALPAALLLLSFYMNGSAFLGFAVMAAKRGIETEAQGQKSLYYLTGLAEGAETIAMFALACIFPAAFPWLAYLFAAICGVSALARVVIGWRALG